MGADHRRGRARILTWASVMARARVRGFQGDDPAAPDRVLACAKHWVAYGAAEGGRDYNAVDVSERTLRTVYFPPFRAALEAGVGTVHERVQHHRRRARLRRTRSRSPGCSARSGSSTASSSATTSRCRELLAHGVAADEADAARQALMAGRRHGDGEPALRRHLPRLVKEGKVPGRHRPGRAAGPPDQVPPRPVRASLRRRGSRGQRAVGAGAPGRRPRDRRAARWSCSRIRATCCR